MAAAIVTLAALAGTLIAAAVAVGHRDEGTADRRRLLAIGLGVRRGVGAVTWIVLATRGSGFLCDEGKYLGFARRVMGTGAWDPVNPYLNGLGTLYRVTGPSLGVGRALSVWAGSLV